MQLLSSNEIIQVSAGNQELVDSMAHYSFFTGILGGAVSGAYALLTNVNVSTTIGTTTTITGSFVPTFWMGLGLSWVVGAAIGAGVALYNESQKVTV